MARPMSFSDRQHFVSALAICRNLTVACEGGEHHDSALRKRCEELLLAIDNLCGELVGDHAYLRIKDVQSRA
ncbi:hypothetical protein BH10PSE7_BH10PSE7_00390 [soil metagenome]